jgi:hypothetical protein
MLVADLVVAVVMLGMGAVLCLDSAPMKGALYAVARWRHRRRTGHFHAAKTGLGALLVIVAAEASPGVAGARELRPLDLGWERIFTVTSDTVEHRGRPIVEGYVNNTSPYDMAGVRVLVDSLDGSGRIVDQKINWLPGGVRGGGRLYFEVPVVKADRYQVRVFSYDRTESAGLMGS